MARYLITGIAGFIRSSLASALVERGDEVRGVDNLATGKRDNLRSLAPRVIFVKRTCAILPQCGMPVKEWNLFCTMGPLSPFRFPSSSPS